MILCKVDSSLIHSFSIFLKLNCDKLSCQYQQLSFQVLIVPRFLTKQLRASRLSIHLMIWRLLSLSYDEKNKPPKVQ